MQGARPRSFKDLDATFDSDPSLNNPPELVRPSGLSALCALAFVGLAVTFNKAQRDKTIDRVILVLDPLIILDALYLLFVR